MPYNTKILKKDADNFPAPQVFATALDDYFALTGDALGGGRYGSDSIQWGKTTGGVYVPVQVDSNGVVQTALTGSNNQVSLGGKKPVLIQQGTITGISSQYPQTPTINEPSTVYRRFILAYHNGTGQTLNTIMTTAVSATISGYTGQDIEVGSVSPTAGANGQAGVLVFNSESNPYLFMFGAIQFQFNLAAVASSGSMDWALYGANY